MKNSEALRVLIEFTKTAVETAPDDVKGPVEEALKVADEMLICEEESEDDYPEPDDDDE